jgi:hypothetical protein
MRKKNVEVKENNNNTIFANDFIELVNKNAKNADSVFEYIDSQVEVVKYMPYMIKIKIAKLITDGAKTDCGYDYNTLDFITTDSYLRFWTNIKLREDNLFADHDILSHGCEYINVEKYIISKIPSSEIDEMNRIIQNEIKTSMESTQSNLAIYTNFVQNATALISAIATQNKELEEEVNTEN